MLLLMCDCVLFPHSRFFLPLKLSTHSFWGSSSHAHTDTSFTPPPPSIDNFCLSLFNPPRSFRVSYESSIHSVPASFMLHAYIHEGRGGYFDRSPSQRWLVEAVARADQSECPERRGETRTLYAGYLSLPLSLAFPTSSPYLYFSSTPPGFEYFFRNLSSYLFLQTPSR